MAIGHLVKRVNALKQEESMESITLFMEKQRERVARSLNPFPELSALDVIPESVEGIGNPQEWNMERRR